MAFQRNLWRFKCLPFFTIRSEAHLGQYCRFEKKGRPPVVSGGREEGCFDGQRVLSKEKEEVFFGGGRAVPEGGWNGAEICSVSPYMLTACGQILYVLSVLLDALALCNSKARANAG